MAARTPDNPSARAILKVKDPLEPPCTCEHCEGDVSVINNSKIYNGRSFGEWPWLYACNDCDARVGMHPFTNIPLGTLATAEIRKARIESKKEFEPFYKEMGLSRTKAYKLLAEEMKIPIRECHFGWFGIDKCKQATAAIEAIQDRLSDNRRPR